MLRFEPQKMLEYDYFSSWSDLPDRPENYQIVAYRVKPKGDRTVLTITQRNIDTLEKKTHSAQTWGMLIGEMQKLLETHPS